MKKLAKLSSFFALSLFLTGCLGGKPFEGTWEREDGSTKAYMEFDGENIKLKTENKEEGYEMSVEAEGKYEIEKEDGDKYTLKISDINVKNVKLSDELKDIYDEDEFADNMRKQIEKNDKMEIKIKSDGKIEIDGDEFKKKD